MSEVEEPEPKTGKRMVSKREYARYVRRRIRFYLTSWVVGMALVFCVHCAVFLLLPPHKANLSKSLLWAFIFVPGMMVMAVWSRRIDGRPEPGPKLPGSLLPAPDTLVRASEQPLQAQDAVLLRAAAQGVETPAEQLVRPT